MYTNRNICTTRVPTSSHLNSKFAHQISTYSTNFRRFSDNIWSSNLSSTGASVTCCPYIWGSQGGGASDRLDNDWGTFLERAQQLDHYTEVLLKIINATQLFKFMVVFEPQKTEKCFSRILLLPRSDTLTTTTSWAGAWPSTATTSLKK